MTKEDQHWTVKVNIKVKGKERGGFFKPNFLQNANKLSKSNREAPNSRAEVVINVGLIKFDEKGIASIKRGIRLAIKLRKSSLLPKLLGLL